MECDDYAKNGLCSSEVSDQGGRVGLKLGTGGARALRLVGAPRVAGALLAAAGPRLAVQPDHPFMSTMDEISYWIYTKRAPCLMNYDNTSKKRSDEAHCSKTKPKSVPSDTEVPSPKKKKKRKLSLLDDDSGSAEKQQNIYFDTSQNKKQTAISSCKSETIGSDIDFNIKTSTGKQKRSKPQKNSRTTLHKKNKVITSTPKVSQLRRSLRQAQQSHNNNCQLNSSFEVLNASVINGHHQNHNVVEQKSPVKTKKSTEILAGGDQSTDNKKNTTETKFNRSKNEGLNGQFEDLSDVSGFTANYIRSTKLQSTKTPRKLRCKNNRNLLKESRQSAQKDCTMVVSANKSVNANLQSTFHNCSTESENIINLVSTRSTEKTAKVSKGTSLLKFMDTKTGKEAVNNNKVDGTRPRLRTNLNVSFQSQSSTSRYPKRYRNNSTNQDEETSDINQADKRRKISKNSSDFNNSDRKENPEAATASRTRSGRSIGLTLRQPENSVLVLSNSTEQVSSMVSINVASPTAEPRERKKKRITRYLRSKKVIDKHGCLQRDSLRDKSGFTACFSDSDDDSEPLKQRKFFCA